MIAWLVLFVYVFIVCSVSTLVVLVAWLLDDPPPGGPD